MVQHRKELPSLKAINEFANFLKMNFNENLSMTKKKLWENYRKVMKRLKNIDNILIMYKYSWLSI